MIKVVEVSVSTVNIILLEETAINVNSISTGKYRTEVLFIGYKVRIQYTHTHTQYFVGNVPS